MWWGSYIGLPFASGGRDAQAVDCWGLVRLVYARELGVQLPAYGAISADETRRYMRAIEAGTQSPTWQKVSDPQAFDVAVMRAPSGRRLAHVGLVVDARHLLHVERATSVALDRVDSVRLAGRIAGFWRHREVPA